VSERESEEVEAAGSPSDRSPSDRPPSDRPPSDRPPSDRSPTADDLVQAVADFVDDLVVDGPETSPAD
jgi:hypothetical protein